MVVVVVVVVMSNVVAAAGTAHPRMPDVWMCNRRSVEHVIVPRAAADSRLGYWCTRRC